LAAFSQGDLGRLFYCAMTLEELMHLAIDQARLARAMDEVPIGCVIWHEPTNRIIGVGHNRRIVDQDPTAHAEILAIRQAAKALGDWRLLDTILAVTLEPCPMCAGAIVNARIPKLIYGCPDPKAGAVRTLYQLCEDQRLNHRVEVAEGIIADDCAALLTDFFKAQRALGKK
jgi:tRNA(adenine34) deaminase